MKRLLANKVNYLWLVGQINVVLWLFLQKQSVNMYQVYGIPNCDTVKKALTWLKDHEIAYEFNDYKKKGITPQKLKAWSKQLGWEALLNKKGTTWKNLDAATQAKITNEKAAIALLVDHTSMIKRPLIEKGEKVVALGFDAEVYEEVFG